MKHKVVKKHNNSDDCMVCGLKNPYSAKCRFYELDNGELVALFTTMDMQQSYPNRTHGGFAAAVLDETIGRAININEPDCFGVTIELKTHYRHPVPIGVPLKAVGRVTRNTRKIFEGEGEILLPDGTAAVTASGKFMKMPLSEITKEESMHNQWYLVKEDTDPVEIDL